MDGLKIKIFLIWLIVQVLFFSFTEAIKFFASESLGVKVTTQLASYWDWRTNRTYLILHTQGDPASLSSHGSIDTPILWVSNAIFYA